MKRFMLLLPLVALAPSALAQTSQPDSEDSTMRVQTTLKAASAKETLPGMAEPEADPAQTTPAEMDSPQTSQPEANQQEVNPAQTVQPEMNESDSIEAGTESLPRSCANLRAEIDRKIRDNDVLRFTLEVVPTTEAESITAMGEDRQNGAEIVGSCDAGSYKIVYRRG